MERNPSTAVFTDRLTWGTVVAGAAAVLYKTTASQQQTVTGSGIATVAALATDGALGGVGLNASTGMVLVMVYAMYRMYLIPTRIRSKSYHDPRHPRFKAMRTHWHGAWGSGVVPWCSGAVLGRGLSGCWVGAVFAQAHIHAGQHGGDGRDGASTGVSCALTLALAH